jgi:TatA/E family protein of Tat protein translocase
MIDGLRRSWRLRSSLLIVLIDFGSGKLSELGSAIGRSNREFRQSVRDETSGHRTSE